MSIPGLIGETFIQSELQFQRERAMMQYNRRPRRQHRHHLAWPFARHESDQRHHGRPAVS